MKFEIHPLIASVASVIGLIPIGLGLLSIAALMNPADTMDEQHLCRNFLKGKQMAKTELFFGLSKPDGSLIREADFQRFVNQEVTPRFPEGLTIVNAVGQYKDAQRRSVQERSKLLLLLYPISHDVHQRIEKIRSSYREKFHQQSVLRADERSCVSF